jgi:hypothetical protein
MGGLVVLAAIVTTFLCAQRTRHKREAGEQTDPKPALLDSNSMGERRFGPLLPYTRSDLVTTSSSSPGHSSPITVQDTSHLRYLNPTSLEVPFSSAGTSFSSNLPSAGNETMPNKEPYAIFAPSPSSPAASSSRASEQLMPESLHSAASPLDSISIAQLTDDQIGLLSRLSSANVPATDIAQLMERMKAGRASGGQGLRPNGTDSDSIAPPSYNVID